MKTKIIIVVQKELNRIIVETGSGKDVESKIIYLDDLSTTDQSKINSAIELLTQK
jgi:hypothetical protein